MTSRAALSALPALAVIAVVLLAACGDAFQEDEAATPETPRASTTATASPAPTATPEADTTPPISADQFCAQAQLEITRWDLPPVLTDEIQTGTIELRYRIPPGAEALVIWMGTTIEVGPVTFGDVFALDPSYQALFPNADPDGVIPATIPSDGFDLEVDTRIHTIEVPITLPPESGFDGTEPWRWSSLSPPPFEVGEPWVLATFRADGVRVRLDGRYCTPIIVPLP